MIDIDQRIAALEAQLAELKAEVGGPATATGPTPATIAREATGDEHADGTSNRRTMFKKLALGAAGVAAVGTAGSLLDAMPAAATVITPGVADGDGVSIGNANSGSSNSDSPTRLSWNSSTQLPKVNGILIGSTVNSNAFTVADNPTGFFLFNKFTSNFPAAVGGYAYSVLEYGMYGFSANKAGVAGFGDKAAFHAIGTKTVANMLLDPHTKGDIIATDNGDLYVCVADGTPGTLRKVAGTATAGSFHLLASPVRVYDSRPVSNGPAATNDGALSGGAERTVSLASGFVGAVATPAVPAGATAALITLTVTGTTNGGFLAVFSNAVAYPGTSNINWSSSNQDIATTTVSGVDAAAKVKLHAGGSPTGTNLIIDVTGYYL